MAFSYDMLEDTVVAYLQPLMPNAIVASMPDDEDQYKQVADKPIVYVAYTESSFQPTTATDMVKQDEKPMIVCNVRGSRRRGNNGVNAIITDLQKNLQGLKIATTGCDPLQLDSIKLVNRDADRREWEYNVAFFTKKQRNQVIEETVINPVLLQEVIFNDTVQLS